MTARTLLVPVVALLVGLVATEALAADRPYELSAERYVTVAGEPVSIRLTLANSDERVEEVRHDGGGSLRAAGSENRVEIVNGNVSQVSAQRYRFVARKPGRYTVGPAIVRTASGPVRTNTVEIIVQPPGDARYFELQHAVQPPVVFEGQPFALVVTAAHGTDLKPVGWTPPRVAGVRPLLDPDQIQPVGGRVQRGDRIFQQMTIAQWFVADRSGTFVLKDARLDVEYPNRRPRHSGRPPSPFGFDSWDMFGSRMTRNSVSVPPTTVTVLPLPPVPEGRRFIGAVGRLVASWERLERSARQWRGVLHLRGKGAAIALDVDEWSQQGWRIWPDAPQVQHRIRGTHLELDVQIPVTLVPGGGADPGPAWFDPTTRTWVGVPALPVTGETGASTLERPVVPEQAGPAADGGAARRDALVVVQSDPAWSRWLSLRVARAGAATATIVLLLLFVGGRLRAERQNALDVARLLETACATDALEAWQEAERQLAGVDDALALSARRLIGAALYRPDPQSPRDAIRELLRQEAQS